VRLKFEEDRKEINIDILSVRDHHMDLKIQGHRKNAFVSLGNDGVGWVHFRGQVFEFKRLDRLPEDHVMEKDVTELNATRRKIVSPMPGKIVKILVRKNSRIKEGDILVVVESMKMENNLIAPFNGTVTDLFVTQDQLIDSSEVLMVLSSSKDKDVL
jgi:biotin carboxyl carrier protein